MDTKRGAEQTPPTREQLQSAIDAADLGLWELDLSSECWTHHCLRHDQLFGYQAWQPQWSWAMAERHVFDEDKPVFRQAVARALETGCLACEVRVRWPDGTLHWIAPRGKTYRDESGRPMRMAGVVTDVTEGRAAQEAQRRSEERLRRVLAIQTVGVLFFGLDGCIHDANAAFERMTGYKVSELRSGSHWKSLTPPEFWGMTAQAAAELAQCGETAPYEKQFTRKDGTRFWGRFSPMRLSGSGPDAECMEFIIDITAAKTAEAALRESEERFRLLVQAISQAVWEADAQGRLVVDSPSWRAYTGQSLEQFLGTGWLDAIHPEDRAWVEQHWREAVAAPQRVHAEFRLKRADGNWSWTSAQAAPVLDDAGRVLKWVGMNIDITDRKLAEDALRQADRRKDEFLATLAHELRNPLAPLRNAAHLLGAPELRAEQLRWVRQLIERQVGHMARLLDDLLDVARITQGKLALKLERVSVASIIESAVEAARPLIDHKRHALRISIDGLDKGQLLLQADPVRLSQVLANLLTNAAKYTDAGGRIELSGRRCGSELSLSVCDNGIGLPREARTRIFDMFSQLESGTGRAEGGLGIGLALVRGIVELHGGRVAVDSAGPGQGSCFTVELPLGQASEPVPGDAQQPSLHAGLKVLIADDNEDAAQTLNLLLSFEGCDTRVATSGQAVVQEAARWQPDVAVLDIGMPELDGYAVARALRQQPGGQHMLLVALTGYGQDDHRRKSAAAGFDHHLTKPVDIGHLLALIAASKSS